MCSTSIVWKWFRLAQYVEYSRSIKQVIQSISVHIAAAIGRRRIYESCYKVYRLSGSGVHAAVVVSPPQEAKLAWMKESITIPEGMSCDVLNWWKVNAPRFPLIAKVANIVLATPASEAICERGRSGWGIEGT